MRILVTTFTFPPQVNGLAEVVRVHVEHLVRQGHQVTVATSFEQARKSTIQATCGYDVVQFNVTGAGHARAGYSGEVAKYKDFIRSWKGDLMMCHAWQNWSTDLTFGVLSDLKCKKVLVSHGFSAHYYPLNVRFPRGFATWLAWRPYVWRAAGIMRKFDKVIFLSEMANNSVYYDHFLARKHRLKNLSVIPSGVFPEEFDASLPNFREVYGIGSGPLVLWLSNYDYLKNPLMAMKAFAKAQVRDATLVLVGKNFNEHTLFLREWMTEAGGEEKVGRVIFLERLDRKMSRAAFKAADVFLCTSLWESGPLVILEAMASGTAFISVNVGFVSQLPGGVVVEGEEQMATEIRKFIGNRELCLSLGAQGRQACEAKYNWPTIMGQYDSILKSLVGSQH